MKLGPVGSWKMYSSVLYFGHPPVTWQLQADAKVEDLLVRNREISHDSHGAVYCVLVWTHKCCCLTYTHWFYWCLLNNFLCLWTLSSFIFFLCCLRGFLLSWKSGGEFSVLCQCLFKISQSCVSPGPEFPCRSDVTRVCCHKLERPVGPRSSAIWA